MAMDNATTDTVEVPNYNVEHNIPISSILTQIVVLVIFISSIVLYIVICKNKEFHTPGYALLVQHNVVSLVFLGPGIVVFFLGVWKFHDSNLQVPDWILIFITGGIQTGAYYMKVYTLVVIAFQRYCAVVHYYRFKVWFSRKNMILICVVTCMLGGIMGLPCTIGPCQFTYNLDTFVSEGNNNHAATRAFFVANIILTGIASGLVVVFYALMFVGRRRFSNRVRPNVNTLSNVEATSSNVCLPLITSEFRFSLQMFAVTLFWAYTVFQFNIISILFHQQMISPGVAEPLLAFAVFMITAAALFNNCIYICTTYTLRRKISEFICRSEKQVSH